MSIVKTVWKAVKRLFSPGVAGAIAKGVELSVGYLPEIYQVAEWLARMTPGRTDDEILTAARALGVPHAVSGKAGGDALAAIVIAWAARKWPGVPERRIRRALEIALAAIKP